MHERIIIMDSATHTIEIFAEIKRINRHCIQGLVCIL